MLPGAMRLREENSFEHLHCFLPGLLALGARHATNASRAAAAWDVTANGRIPPRVAVCHCAVSFSPCNA